VKRKIQVTKIKKVSGMFMQKNHPKAGDVAHGRQQNLKNHSITETSIGKFKDFFGATLLRFRPAQVAGELIGYAVRHLRCMFYACIQIFLDGFLCLCPWTGQASGKPMQKK
jgi:hypothetical protein